MTRGARIVLAGGAALAGIVAVAALVQPSGTVDVQVLAINDFHGALEPAPVGTGPVDEVEAGGVEYLATHLARLKAANPNTVIVSAGDNIGATPLLSSLFHDEVTIEALNLAGLQLSALGNHDLDEGWWELYRIQRGGCHPEDGCQDGTPYTGAAFTYLAANVTLDPRRADPASLARAGIRGADPRPLLPPYVVREIDGVRVGFIGLILQEAPSVTLASSIRGLTFLPEADAANTAARALRGEGVRAIVVLMHEGGDRSGADVNGCDGISGDLVDLVNRLSRDIDVVVSGHSHQAYNCTIDGRLVTSAADNGRLITDIDLRIRRSDGAVVARSAQNVIVTRDVEKDRRQTALLEHYRPFARTMSGRIVGSIAASLTREANAAGESALGDVVADALLDAATRTPGASPDLAMWNPGGIRTDLFAGPGGRPTPVTYEAVFSVLPFGNELIVKSITGEALLEMLEQQFGAPGAERVRIVQVSEGFTYAYDASRPIGQRIDRASVRLHGKPIVPMGQYRLATSDYLWDGGDGLRALGAATDAVMVGTDHDLFAGYFSRHSPVRPGPQNRIRRIR
ncbi:MAG: bifunctional metallophosphatase/5'-nucleotidase [Acidobacteria bacterium]|nr:bifunctional metallophosphatase/5'-nucleotidase [Acidobacteriota bacterium]